MPSIPSVVNFDAMPLAQRAQGLANILSIGTATPSNCFYQSDYPEYYFRITNSQHMVGLKDKFKRMCDNSMIKKRYLHHTEEFLKENPNMCGYNTPSLNTRQDLLFNEIPNLGKEAATKAIKQWGFETSKITHLIFCTTSNLHVPGPDYHLTNLLGLSPSINRLMMYQQGCSGGGTALRLAKDVAENNKDSRVLVVCCEMTSSLFRGPHEGHVGSLVGQALFGDGAAAIIVGSDPVPSKERGLFEIVSATQTILPETENAMKLHVGEAGLNVELTKDVPKMISKGIEMVLQNAFSPLGISDWNSLFWIVHPGGRAILDEVEVKLNLKKEKLGASRHVLSEYGNLGSGSVLFVMDETRRISIEEGKSTIGEGVEFGVLLGIGSGITVETVVLRSYGLGIEK